MILSYMVILSYVVILSVSLISFTQQSLINFHFQQFFLSVLLEICIYIDITFIGMQNFQELSLNNFSSGKKARLMF